MHLETIYKNIINELAPFASQQHKANEVRVFLWFHSMSREELIKWTTDNLPGIDLAPFQKLKDKRLLEQLSVRILLYKTLGPNVTVSKLSTGRPVLSNCNKEISISHTRNAYILSVGNLRHGVDAEVLGQKAYRTARMFTTESEQLKINRATTELHWEPEEFYTTIWSAKESIYKCCDQPGLSFKEQILFNKAQKDTLFFHLTENSKNNNLEIFFAKIDNVALTLCTSNPETQLNVNILTAEDVKKQQ